MTRAFSSVAAAFLVIAGTSGCNDRSPTAPGTAPSAALTAVSGNARDHAAMQQIVNTFDATWAVDAETYAGQYAGAEWVGPNGNILTDPAAITATYAFLFQQIFPNTTRESSIRNLTFLTGTIAVLDIVTEVSAAGNVIACALEKNILLKRSGEWRIVQHQQLIVANDVRAGGNSPCPTPVP